MVKSGKYEVNQGSIFGRLGSGIGKGLAEQLPREMDRGRLASGLKQFEQEAQGLSPLQQATRLFSIPGITPQMVQVLPDLLKQQNERQAAINAGRQGVEAGQTNDLYQPQQFVREDQPHQSQINPQRRGENIFKAAENLATRERGISTKGPIAAALSDIRAPTQQELFNKRSEILSANPWMTVDAAQRQAEDYFNRLNAQKTAEIEKGARQESIENKIDTAFDKELELLLQKKGNEVYKDVSGEYKAALRNKAEQDVANGVLTPTQAARKYANLALDLSKGKQDFNKMSQSPLILQNPRTVRKNLEFMAKTAKDVGRSEEYSKELESQFGLSTPYASSIAFPVKDSKDLNNYIEKVRPQIGKGLALIPDTAKAAEIAKKQANDISKMIGPNDSVNSIIVSLKSKDPYFDESAFMDQLRNLYEQGSLQVNPRQRRELESQETSWFPSLHDLWMKISSQF